MREATPRFSMVIPLHRDGPRFRDCLEHARALVRDGGAEVIVVSDQPVELPDDVVAVTTGSSRDTSPAVKRDAAMPVAAGRVLAFIDDDAYPAPDWLERAGAALGEQGVGGVGGPGLTPPRSPWRERLGGAVYESRLGSGPLRHRFLPLPPTRYADDLPAYNLLIRREALEEIGGWGTTFYGGEDTELCLRLLRAGHRLRYDPSVRVFHHRRPVFRAHMRQIGNVGRHRGFFVRRYPATSRRPVYFLPVALTVGMLPALGVLVVAAVQWPGPVAAGLGAGWVVLSATAAPRAGWAAAAFPIALLCHHLAYGLNFIRGLFGRPIEF